MATDQRGPEFTLTPDAIDHPSYLKLGKGTQLRLIRAAVKSRQYCALGMLWLYDDEIARMLDIQIDVWERDRDKALDRGLLYKTEVSGKRVYEFAFWFVPTWEGDTRRSQTWHQDRDQAESLLKEGQVGRPRIFVDDREKNAYARAKKKAEQERRTVPTLDEWRASRADYDDAEIQAREDDSESSRDTKLPSKNNAGIRNDFGAGGSLSTEVVVLPSDNIKELLPLVSDLCLARYEFPPNISTLNRNDEADIIQMMRLVGVSDKTIFQELLPEFGFEMCLRQLILLPYNDPKIASGFFCDACRGNWKVPGKFDSMMAKRRTAAAQEQQRQQQDETRAAAAHEKEILTFRLEAECASLTPAELDDMERHVREAALQTAQDTSNTLLLDMLRQRKDKNPIVIGELERRRNMFLQARMDARALAAGVDYLPPDVSTPLPATEEPDRESQLQTV